MKAGAIRDRLVQGCRASLLAVMAGALAFPLPQSRADPAPVTVPDVVPVRDDGWTVFAASTGRLGASVCNEDEVNFSCVAIACRRGEPLKLLYLFSGGLLPERLPMTFAVDGEIAASVVLTAVDRTAEYEMPLAPAKERRLVKALREGETLIAFTGRKGFAYSLKHSASLIDDAFARCPASAR